MIVVGNGAFFRNDKKNLPWDFKKYPGTLHFPLLAREYLGHKARRGREHIGYETLETQEYVGNETRGAREHLRHEST